VGSRRRGRGGGRSVRPRPGLPEQRPFAQPRLLHGPTQLATPEQLDAIHDSSLAILRDIGMQILDPETRQLYAAAGAAVDGQRVRFDPEMIVEIIATAPSQFTLHARNPDHDIVIGGDLMAFGSVASAPNVADLDNGRRTGNRHDFQNLLRLVQSLNSIHFTPGYPVEPMTSTPRSVTSRPPTTCSPSPTRRSTSTPSADNATSTRSR
jgi:trimethylamine--corrinoid protein Co-methyltransferase